MSDLLPVDNPIPVVPDQETFQKKAQLLMEKEALLSAKRRLTCENDFEKFCKIYLESFQTHKSPPFHIEMRELLSQTIAGPNKLTRLLFIAPRGFAKSTNNSIFYPLWCALYKKKTDIFLVSATMSLAKEHMRKLRKEFETNEKILSDFGDLRSDKWTEDILALTNHVILRAKGRGFQIRGFRPDCIICDDLEDEEIIYSKEQRDKMEHWFFRTLLPSLKPDQTLIYVGTKIHQFSLISKLQEKEEFTVRFYKALTAGNSIWEELWPTDKLYKLKKEMGEYAFQAEYQNNPISLEEQPIKPHMLDGVVIRGRVAYSVLAIDPAISEKESSDYRAFTIFGKIIDDSGEIIGFKELYSEKNKLGIDDQINRVIELYETFKPDRVVIEEVAFQKVYRPILMKRAREKGIIIPVTEAILGGIDRSGKLRKSPKDKVTRLMGIVHLFEQRLVEVKNPELYQELVSFPHGDNDDLVDATVYALSHLVVLRDGRAIAPKSSFKLVETKESFVVSEVRPGVFMAQAPDMKVPFPVKSSILNIDKR